MMLHCVDDAGRRHADAQQGTGGVLADIVQQLLDAQHSRAALFIAHVQGPTVKNVAAEVEHRAPVFVDGDAQRHQVAPVRGHAQHDGVAPAPPGCGHVGVDLGHQVIVD
ncbi:MAG: hypothetical protein R2854_23865 [Caldilineaceae bacterium]